MFYRRPICIRVALLLAPGPIRIVSSQFIHMRLEPLFEHREPRDAPESIVRLVDALQARNMRLQSLVWHADFLTESALINVCFSSDARLSARLP